MQKLYHSISEVSQLLDEEQHILRYWEKEFDQLNPKKNRGGNRIYSDKDVFILKTIKKLLREEKLSLKGAKEQVSKLLSGVIDDSLFAATVETVSVKQENAGIKTSENKVDGVLAPDNISLSKEELIELNKLLKEISAVLE